MENYLQTILSAQQESAFNFQFRSKNKITNHNNNTQNSVRGVLRFTEQRCQCQPYDTKAKSSTLLVSQGAAKKAGGEVWLTGLDKSLRLEALPSLVISSNEKTCEPTQPTHGRVPSSKLQTRALRTTLAPRTRSLPHHRPSACKCVAFITFLWKPLWQSWHHP